MPLPGTGAAPWASSLRTLVTGSPFLCDTLTKPSALLPTVHAHARAPTETHALLIASEGRCSPLSHPFPRQREAEKNPRR